MARRSSRAASSSSTDTDTDTAAGPALRPGPRGFGGRPRAPDEADGTEAAAPEAARAAGPAPVEAGWFPNLGPGKRRGTVMPPAEPRELLDDLGEMLREPDSLKEICTADAVYNVELSWMSFNWRVLAMALDPDTPMLERLNFLAITASNLDEFFAKRIGGLKRQEAAQRVRKLKLDRRRWSPSHQLEVISPHVKDFVQAQSDVLRGQILPALEPYGVKIVESVLDLDVSEQRRLERYFQNELELLLTPIKLDPGHPFPFLHTMEVSLAIALKDKNTGTPTYAVVSLPGNLPRWHKVNLPWSAEGAGQDTGAAMTGYIPLENIIEHNLGRLFGGWEILGTYPFRVTRNAEMDRHEEECEDLLDMISDEVKMRQFAPFVRLEVGSKMPEGLVALLVEELELNAATDVFKMDCVLDLAAIRGLKPTNLPAEFEFEDFRSRVSKELSSLRLSSATTSGDWSAADDFKSIFSVIRQGDILLHHPYQSFARSTLRFFEEAASDPNVLAIKCTLYRTSSNSGVIRALLKAAESGKQVTVLVELKARFDEERNVEFATRLEKAGCNVTYGLVGLKTHGKTTLVVRRESDAPSGLRTYVHIGTGNYNPVTAGIYTDFGLLSSDPALGKDVVDVFKHLTGLHIQEAVGGYEKLLVAKVYMKKQFLELIDNEIQNARQGLRAAVTVKVNGLDDIDLTQKLYEAAAAGVRVDAIVRGVCRLRPGVPGLSENIRVVSVVGRFLEHHRVFVFHNAGDPRYFFGSADWMTRNLERRVEVAVPISSEPIKRRIKEVLAMFLCDGVGSWEKREDGSYHNPATRTNEATRSALFVAGEKLEESFIKDIMERSMQVGAQQTLIELGQREDVPKQ